jgi:N-acetylglucosaminyldiphosphoundecaprenol N-acetyl-beta-D-mannosaminyltransferase
MVSTTLVHPSSSIAGRRSYVVLGVRVDAVTMSEVVAQLRSWIDSGARGVYVAVTGMHGLGEAKQDPQFRTILNSAGLVVPDGMPLVWLARLHGMNLRRRVYGPELLDTFCAETRGAYRHFFYGGASGVAQELAAKLESRFGIVVAGTYTPPFRPLTHEEDREVGRMIESSNANILWVGLSTPKQERWMYAHRNNVSVPVMLGVGAAFDINSERVAHTPDFFQDHGLEWLYRLMREPKRLWKRYLIEIPRVALSVCLELLGNFR